MSPNSVRSADTAEDPKPSRRGVLASVGRAALAAAALPALAAAQAETGPPPGESAEKQTEATAGKVVDALEGAYGPHPGQRRNHAKGVGARGVFVGNPQMAAYSRSALFSGATLEVVARFSVAGGNPDASDAERSSRGLAVQFRMPNGGLHHMTMLNTPMFFAAVPQTFLDKFVALAVDSATGKPDPDKFKSFLATHGDNAGQTAFLNANNPAPSYANCAFFGIHTFRFINKQEKVTLVKFRFVPQDGEKQLTDAERESAPPDFLEKALLERLAKGPARWDLILTIGEPGDEQINPTVLWPKGRREVKAGTLTLVSATPSAEAGSYRINYDPLVMADGIAATDDPVLLFRSPSYGVSYTRRLQNL